MNEEQAVLIIAIICTTIVAIIVTLKEQIGYKRTLDRYIARYGDLAGYSVRV
jgi:hypothetical protein